MVREKPDADNSSQRGNIKIVTSKSPRKKKIKAPKGKLGVLLPGIGGAVSTTFVAGVEAIKAGIGKPIGSLTQLGSIRIGKRTEKNSPLIKDLLPLYDIEDLVFYGWDPYPDNCYDAALNAGVLEQELLAQIKEPLKSISPSKAVFEKKFVKNLNGKNIKKAKTKMDLANDLIKDIETFKKENKLDRLVMVWCASTEVYLEKSKVHKSITSFEKGLKQNSPAIAPSMIYAYAAIKTGTPYANGAPNLSADVPALEELAKKNKVPICGKDFKTGQTLMKTILAPGLKSRLLGVNGWFSTNILGNRDGEVLDDPYSFKTKEASKLSVLEYIFQPELYPELYSDYYHKVRINYYPPRGDEKEAWDNIDIFGWLGYPMQIKVNFLCRDSILAAPIVLDLVLFLDLAQRAGMSGIQEWLSFYFKSPMVGKQLYPEHDVFIQLMKLKNTLRYLAGEELITHLGLDYYD
ncbi:MAG: inositol-3-phosphate synthase [Candidatus Dadabacteria bacterium]|nr:inositol-3-phosphate synthase [Candidatus Dadabacteria bacterium]NIS07414.1 inositol-3-phosphate synthase [Candidatus Dadabacteria bacterium]NIV41604.1 inositol-3-phosphate synthase [Candidatus Dadabacteria bacterium]NIX14607.1 inositol-3-phosphate synthase [Candidatus Dadabacteria bacterium]NIY21070.1 inositol-3-phosphate synthase [Candidatus Dadabacteria bacterium]